MKSKAIKGIVVGALMLVAAFAGAGVHEFFDNDAQLAHQLALAEQAKAAIQLEKEYLESQGPVEVIKYVNQTQVIEKEVEVEVQDPDMVAKLERVEAAYERVTGEEFDYNQLIYEDYAIEQAMALFEDRAERLLDLDFDESVEFLKFFDASAEVDLDARRYIDGKRHEVMVAEAEFTARVRVYDDEGNGDVREYRVEYERDYEADGDVKEDISIDRID